MFRVKVRVMFMVRVRVGVRDSVSVGDIKVCALTWAVILLKFFKTRKNYKKQKPCKV